MSVAQMQSCAQEPHASQQVDSNSNPLTDCTHLRTPALIRTAHADSDGGATPLDLFACVDPHADNGVNELYALPSAPQGGTIMPGSNLMGCVSATPCVAGNSQLCSESECSNGANTKWKTMTSPDGKTLKLSLASSPLMCLSVAAGNGGGVDPTAAFVAVLGPCTSAESEWKVRASVTPPPPPPPPPPIAIRLDGAADGHEFDGHGLLSAGASSRLLIGETLPCTTQ